MRTNPLSKTEGGSTVIVQYSKHSVEYTNIKNTNAYINKILNEGNGQEIIAIYVGSTKVYPNSPA
jgi:hypothetical protein